MPVFRQDGQVHGNNSHVNLWQSIVPVRHRRPVCSLNCVQLCSLAEPSQNSLNTLEHSRTGENKKRPACRLSEASVTGVHPRLHCGVLLLQPLLPPLLRPLQPWDRPFWLPVACRACSGIDEEEQHGTYTSNHKHNSHAAFLHSHSAWYP